MSTIDTLHLNPNSPFLEANQQLETPKTIKKIAKKPAKPKNQTYTLYIPTDLLDQVRLTAKVNKVPINQVFIQALETFINS